MEPSSFSLVSWHVFCSTICQFRCALDDGPLQKIGTNPLNRVNDNTDVEGKKNGLFTNDTYLLDGLIYTKV